MDTLTSVRGDAKFTNDTVVRRTYDTEKIKQLNDQYFELVSIFVNCLVTGNSNNIDLVDLENKISLTKSRIRTLTNWE
jgi:hypothetical protein